MDKINLIKENIEKVIVGKTKTIEYVLAAFLAEGSVLLEDMPGTGKTMLAKSLAKSVGCEFNRVQFTPDLLPQDVTGLNIYNQKTGEFEFNKGPVFTNILLADEINRATPRTQSALLECMQEIQVTTDGTTRPLDKPFFIIATQNPIETAGTYPLPEAELDRFTVKLSMGLPEKEGERNIIDRYISSSPLENISPVVSSSEILEMQDKVKQIYVHDCVKDYIVNIVMATREDKRLGGGINPRGTLSLIRSCQALAFIRGREYVTPDDVKELVVPVFAHRIYGQGKSQSKLNAQIISEIVNEVVVPTEDWTH